MNLFFKKNAVKMNRRNRVLIEAYGAYGLSMSQSFNVVNLAAMERGWVIAQAMVRGGGDCGISWHDQGKLDKKYNSFEDLASCAEWLIANRLTHPNMLAAKGSSAGGTLVA
jgi:protease II